MSAPPQQEPPPAAPVDLAKPAPEEHVDPREQAMKLLKRWDILVDSALSPLVFVGVNLVAGITPAAIAALALAVVVLGFRVRGGQDPTYALGGVFGTAVAAAIAVGTGSTEGFFWPKVATNALIFLGLMGSVAAKRPAIGFLMETLVSVPETWWRHDKVRPALSEWTAVWAGSALLKAIVYVLLIVAGKAGGLLAISLVFGYPVTGALLFGGWVYIKRRLRSLDGPAFPSSVARAQS